MPKFIIERDISDAGSLTTVLKKLGTEIQWVESYVTKDKVYCVYIAPNEELIKEHANEGGFPANKISAVTKIIDPTTSE
jgi:hypothetical protein